MDLSRDLVLRLLDAAPGALLAAGLDGRIVYANAAVEPLLGFEPAELTGRHVEALLAPRSRSEWARHERDCRAASTRPVRVAALHKAGPEVPVEIASRLAAPDAALMLTTLLDVSRELRLEHQLEEARESLRRLRSAANHDLRQPLQALNLLTSAAARHADGDAVLAGIAERQRDAVDRMAELVSALFEKPEPVDGRAAATAAHRSGSVRQHW